MASAPAPSPTGGISSGPTPWWQLPGGGAANNNLTNSAPAGYQWDSTKMQYVPIVGSATDALGQRARSQGIQDVGNSQEAQSFGTQQDITQRLLGAISGLGGGTSNGTSGTGVSTGVGAGVDPSVAGAGGGSATSSSGGAGGGYGGSSITLPAMKAPEATLGAPSWQAIAGPSQAVQDANESATFGKVKDSAANTATAAMRGLSDSLSARGMSGGGYEAGQIGTTLGREANTIGAGEQQWAGQQYADASHRADVDTNAGITARGQDIGAATTTRGQDVNATLTGRGQDLGAATAGLTAGTQRYTTDQNNATAQRGQTLQADTAANALAGQKQIALQSMLTGALGGLSRSNPSLIY